MSTKNIPRIGVWVLIRKDWKILFGKRKNSHWNWFWAFPWWHLEFNEEIEDCAIREVMEEVWIKIKNLNIIWVTNDIFYQENKHYITIFVTCDYDSWDLKLMEPEKCEKWEWFDKDNIPSPLFLPIQNLMKKSFSPFSD